MGNCVACVDKNEKGKKDQFGGLAENNKPQVTVKNVADL